MTPCTSCRETGKTIAMLNPGGMREIPCTSCGGTGRLTPEMAAAIERRKAIRADRIARGETVRSEAKRLGMTAVEYSKLERGEVKP